jgi:hypothetical protein
LRHTRIRQATPQRLGGSGGVALRLAAALLFIGLPPAMAQAPDARLAARIAALEGRVAQLTSALDAAQQQAARPAAAPPRVDRTALAALNLQAVLATGRPFQRELQLLRDAAPAGGLAQPLTDALVSHAARGLSTTAELRESFQALAPVLADRAAPEGDWLAWLTGLLRRALAPLGLVALPQPTAVDTTLANVRQLLVRGQLAPALADLETLEAVLQPLLAGWVAQARARVSAEQAVQEIIMRALPRPEGD